MIDIYFEGPLKAEDQDPRLINPVVDRLCCCLPARWRQSCWCGVNHKIDYEVFTIQYFAILMLTIAEKGVSARGGNFQYLSMGQG